MNVQCLYTAQEVNGYTMRRLPVIGDPRRTAWYPNGDCTYHCRVLFANFIEGSSCPLEVVTIRHNRRKSLCLEDDSDCLISDVT